jgi:hypothetical protein
MWSTYPPRLANSVSDELGKPEGRQSGEECRDKTQRLLGRKHAVNA